MGGQSAQEKASEKLYNESSNINPNVENRFNNLQDAFGYGDISSNINDIFKTEGDNINRTTNEQIAKEKSGAASSLASRGITNGSVLTDTQSKIASDVNKSKTGALSNLATNKSNILANLKQYFNSLKLQKTGLAQNADQQNYNNLLQKYGIQGNAIGGLDDTTWLDDFLSGLNTAGNVAKGGAELATALA